MKNATKFFIAFLFLLTLGIPSTVFAEEESNIEEDTFLMEITRVRESTENKIVFHLSPINREDYPSGSIFHAVFEKDTLGYKFPDIDKIDYENLKVILTAEYEAPLKSRSVEPNILTVKDWDLYIEETDDSLITEVFTVKSVLLEEGEFIHYEVEAVGDSEINRLSLKQSNLPSNFPEESIVGSTIMVKGSIITSDNKTLNVIAWTFVEKVDIPQEPDPPPKTYEIYGRTTDTMFDDYSDEVGIIVWVEFIDHDGNKYLTEWRPDVVDFNMYQLRGNYTLVVSDLPNDDSSPPRVRVHDYTLQPDDYEFKTDDVVSLTGDIVELINEKHHRVTYKFVSNERTFYAVFDKEVLGSEFPTSSLLNKHIELTGVSYRQGHNIFLGVMGYRDPFADGSYGQGKSGINYQVITGTPIFLISYGKDNSSYKVMTNDGLEHTFIFDKKLLKDFPTNMLIGQEYKFTVAFDKSTKQLNSYFVVGMEKTGEQGFQEDRGKFIKLIEEGHSTSRYTFESIEGGRYTVSLNKASVEKFGKAKDLVGMVATIYGKEALYGGTRIFDVYMVSPVNVPHVNKQKNDVVSFRGFVKKITARDPKGITFFAQNQYGQSEYFYMETDFMKEKFPADMALESIVSHEIVVSGYRMDNGIILVSDFALPKVPKEYPKKREPEIQEPDYFPNMQGFTGMIDVSDIGGTHYLLITSTDKYILNGKPEVMKKIEKNIRNMVYLRGEYRESGTPYWTGEIKVYDLQFVDSNTNTITRPISEPIHDLMPDPQKEAHYTIQEHEKPEEFEYGNAIPEAKFFPPVPIATEQGPKDTGNWK